LMGISFCILLLIYKRTYTECGLAIVLAGIPIYYISRWISKNEDTEITNA